MGNSTVSATTCWAKKNHQRSSILVLAWGIHLWLPSQRTSGAESVAIYIIYWCHRVTGHVNLALSRPAAQSSIAFGDVADNAVDGDVDTSSTTLFSDKQPWWKVQLAESVWVRWVEIMVMDKSEWILLCILCAALTSASDWLTAVGCRNVSHVWRLQREIYREKNVVDDVTMTIPATGHLDLWCSDAAEYHCVYTMISASLGDNWAFIVAETLEHVAWRLKTSFGRGISSLPIVCFGRCCNLSILGL